MEKTKYTKLYIIEKGKFYNAIKVENFGYYHASFIIPNFFKKGIHGFISVAQRPIYIDKFLKDNNCQWETKDLLYRLPNKIIKEL